MRIHLHYLIVIIFAILFVIDWFFFDQIVFSNLGWALIALFTDIANWIGGLFSKFY